MSAELVVLMAGTEAGRVQMTAHNRLRFLYDQPWRSAQRSYPLSMSMPLTGSEYGHTAIASFLWGLLPDNEQVLDTWAKKFQVSPRNVFSLIANVGEDCAGAAQFVRPERAASLREKRPQIAWLTVADIAERLRALREDHATSRMPRDTGQFSLAGAQAKTALLLDKGRWGVPSGRTPTTHILKPPSPEFDGHAENELFCLRLAKMLGLPAANATVQTFKAEKAIVVERYDRVRVRDIVVRVHQEDMCQALSLMPTQKYENEGGPGVRTIIDLVREVSSERTQDTETFLSAIVFNWLIAGTDAHAKNYSLLIGEGGRVRLAPLYDLASALPYEKLNQVKLKSAMKIGGEYVLRNISARNWRKLAAETRLGEESVIARVKGMTEAMPDAAQAVRLGLKAEGLTHPMITRLAERLATRANKLKKTMSVTA